MSYQVIVEYNHLLTSEWLQEHFGGPSKYKYNFYTWGYAGPTWHVWVCVDDPLRKITGKFENKEDAVFFKLYWL